MDLRDMLQRLLAEHYGTVNDEAVSALLILILDLVMDEKLKTIEMCKAAEALAAWRRA
jgi:hypothetical protein